MSFLKEMKKSYGFYLFITFHANVGYFFIPFNWRRRCRRLYGRKVWCMLNALSHNFKIWHEVHSTKNTMCHNHLNFSLSLSPGLISSQSNETLEINYIYLLTQNNEKIVMKPFHRCVHIFTTVFFFLSMILYGSS